MKTDFIKWVFEQGFKRGCDDFEKWLADARGKGILYGAAGLTVDGAFFHGCLSTHIRTDFIGLCSKCGYNCRPEEEIPCCVCSNLDVADKDSVFYANHYREIKEDWED
jgi:hypothetical protein